MNPKASLPTSASVQLLIYADSDPSKRPITTCHPTIQPLLPTTQTVSNVRFPSTLTTALPLSPRHPPTEETQETIFDLLEYLDMLTLASPQVEVSDKTDAFISRYKTPDLAASVNVDASYPASGTIKVLRWTGLISSQWVLKVLSTIM